MSVLEVLHMGRHLQIQLKISTPERGVHLVVDTVGKYFSIDAHLVDK